MIKVFKLTEVQVDAILNMRLGSLKKLDELNFVWFEAPFDDFDWDSYQWLRSQIKTPVIKSIIPPLSLIHI